MRNRTILKLFNRDFTYALSYGKYKYIVFYSLLAFLALMISLQIKSYGSNSMGIFFLLLKDKGYIQNLSDYQIPFYWDFTQFFVLFLIGDYLFQDHESNRVYVLIRCHSKMKYLFSKIYWIIVQNLLIFLGVFIVVYIISSLTLNDFSIGSSPYFLNHIEVQMANKVTPVHLLIRLFVGFVMTSIVLSCLLLLCIQFTTPIVSFLSVIILCSVSTFSGIKWLPAIHSMILRSNVFNHAHHLTFGFSISYCIGLYIIITLLTLFVFKNIDFL